MHKFIICWGWFKPCNIRRETFSSQKSDQMQPLFVPLLTADDDDDDDDDGDDSDDGDGE